MTEISTQAPESAGIHGPGAPPFAFDNNYARMPERFFAQLTPTPAPAPRLIRLNETLA
jgi:serine/tyrosine/threonine adenylyltransferase